MDLVPFQVSQLLTRFTSRDLWEGSKRAGMAHIQGGLFYTKCWTILPASMQRQNVRRKSQGPDPTWSWAVRDGKEDEDGAWGIAVRCGAVVRSLLSRASFALLFFFFQMLLSAPRVGLLLGLVDPSGNPVPDMLSFAPAAGGTGFQCCSLGTRAPRDGIDFGRFSSFLGQRTVARMSGANRYQPGSWTLAPAPGHGAGMGLEWDGGNGVRALAQSSISSETSTA